MMRGEPKDVTRMTTAELELEMRRTMRQFAQQYASPVPVAQTAKRLAAVADELAARQAQRDEEGGGQQ